MALLSLSARLPKSATAYDVPVASDEIGELSPDLQRSAELAGFKGKAGQTLIVTGPAEEAVRVLVGVGPKDALSLETLRTAAAAFVRSVPNHKAVASTLAEEPIGLSTVEAIGAVAEGLGLASYSYQALKTGPAPTLRKVSIIARGAGVKAAFTQAQSIVNAVCLARDLVNEPGGSLTPNVFALKAKDVAKETGLKIQVWDEKRIAREKLGGVLAVNQGSTHPPRFLKIDYIPASKPVGTVALVGKGITFDSGGLSIKSSVGMMTMKVDMTGGAVVLATMSTLKALNVKAAVTAYIPLTDNMINGDAFRPGDVFTARNGKTVEVLNTDAEGRLVLADALSLASEKSPDAIIDIATLTGSVSAALGAKIAGIMGTSDDVLDRLEKAGKVTGESVWQLPLPDAYRKSLDSTIADLKNIGNGPYGGALVAGLFLKEFVSDVPWVHIDLGLSAEADGDDGVIVKGGTAVGVRLLVETLRNW